MTPPKPSCLFVCILSPAKTLNLSPLERPLCKLATEISSQYDSYYPTNDGKDKDKNTSSLLECHEKVVNAMKDHAQTGGTSKLQQLLSISTNLANTAVQYWNDFTVTKKPPNSSKLVKPAIFAFSGAAYQGMDIDTLLSNETTQYPETTSTTSPTQRLQYLQDTLRIIDPVYGVLRPLDEIQPYRLEMATKNVVSSSSSSSRSVGDLANLWKHAVTQRLCHELTQRRVSSTQTSNQLPTCYLLNLASDEYAKAVDLDNLQLTKITNTDDDNDDNPTLNRIHYVKIVFRHQGRVIAIHAKRARGLFVRYMAWKNCTSMEELTAFDWENYHFVETASTEDTLVFDRDSAPSKTKASKTKRATSSLTKPTTGKRGRTKR